MIKSKLSNTENITEDSPQSDAQSDKKNSEKNSEVMLLPSTVRKSKQLPAVRQRRDVVSRKGFKNALEAYLSEIQQIPRLTREEEHALALRFINHDDTEAAYKLVSANLWLVVKLSRNYEKAARSLLDLIQEGNIGLLEAVKNFDPFREVRFPSYAVWWVKAYIVRYVLANWRMVKIGTTQAQRKLFFNLSKEKEKLEREGFYPAPKLIAERLNVREKDVLEMEQRLSGSDLSLDSPMGSDDSDSSLMSFIPSKGLGTEDLVAKQERNEIVKDLMDSFFKTLSSRDKLIFESRMISDDKATLHELSDKLEVSKERVRQIENQIKDKLRKYIEKSLGNRVSDVIEIA